MNTKKVLFLFLLFVAVSPIIASSQGINSPIQAKTIQGAIKMILNIVQIIAVPLAALGIMIASFFYITSAGESAKLTQAKNAILYSVLGLAIAVGAQFMVDVVIGVAEGASIAGGFVEFINNIVVAFGQVLVGLSVLAILYSAFLFLIGGGDEAKIKEAGQTLTYAVIGLVIAALSFAVPRLIELVVNQTIGK